MPSCPNPRCRSSYPQGTTQCTNPFCQCLLPEAVVAGRYRIETLIGLGGMGAVYRATDILDMQQVALKIVSTTTSTSNEMKSVERFYREARYARQIHHKNIVPLLNFGKDGDVLYLVMPLITGGTLKDLLKSEKPLALALIQRYLTDLADALDTIHSQPQRIIHRDIKPSNLLIHQNDGRLVVADFGIARGMVNEEVLTQRGWAIGTQHYVAPEQEHGKAEPVSDVYSMGVVAYQMLTGLLPFQAVVRNHGAALPPPSQLNPEVPLAVDAVLQRAMEVIPSRRYQTAGDFANAFKQALNASSLADMPTVAVPEPIFATISANANIIVRLLIPENPCTACGQENRKTSRFCRTCGQRLDATSPLVTDLCQLGYVSDVGRRYVAVENEDMLLISQGLCVSLAPPPNPFALVAVADGLRGHQNSFTEGHEASRLVLESVQDTLLPLLTTPVQRSSNSASFRTTTGPHRFRPGPPPDTILQEWLFEGVQHANQVVYHFNADYETFMASTIAVGLLYKHKLYVANVGDSRVYHYSSTQGLRCITKDHTLAANLVDVNLLTPDEVYSTSKRNQHYRYLGQTGQVLVDVSHHDVVVDDLIVLCTDGLWHMVRDEQIAEVLAQGGDTQKMARTLVDAANLSGGDGNISVIILRVL